MRKLLAILVTLFLSPLAQADCTAQSALARPHLIELYSSEGCSSCPPAEAWLRSVPNDAKAVALEFHVDYWDALGWRDRFASARYSARQKAFVARTGGGAGVYTPEVVLDGREWRDWYRHPEVPPASAKATMKLSLEPGTPLRAHVDTTLADATGPAYENYVALIEDGLSSEVRAGENRGTLLRHDHVVRAFVGPLAHADADIPMPSDVDWSHAAVVAFAQRARDGDVAQVVMLPLAQCER